MRSSVTLSYDASSCNDGTGAQLQRIFGIYAVSRHFKVNYLHSKIENLTITQLDTFQSDESLASYLRRLNDIFLLPSVDKQIDEYDEVYRVGRLNSKYLKWIKFISFLKGKHVLILVQNPFPTIDKSPDSYSYVQDYFAASQVRSESATKLKTIVLHIRRGSSGADIPTGESSPRMLPNAYYSSLLVEIIEKYCQKQDAFEIVIITDVPKETFVYKPIESQVALWRNEPRFQNGGIEIPGESFADLKVKSLSKFEVLHGGDPITAIEIMRTADFLVMSRSSFSYIGAVLNTNGKVFYPPNFWHKPMRKWVQVP